MTVLSLAQRRALPGFVSSNALSCSAGNLSAPGVPARVLFVVRHFLAFLVAAKFVDIVFLKSVQDVFPFFPVPA